MTPGSVPSTERHSAPGSAARSACEHCPRATIADPTQHARWHRQIAPLTRADAATLEAAYGWPSTPIRTFVDEQFAVARCAS